MAPRLSHLTDSNVRRICVIKPSAFGDVVQAMPLLPVLKRRFPDASLAWVVNAELAPLLEGHPQLDEIIRFERRGPLRSWLTTLRRLREGQFDLVVDLQGLLRTAVMNLATRAPLRVGLESAREGANLVCHEVLPDSGRRVPAHQRYWRVAEALGLGRLSAETEIFIGAEDHDWAAAQLAGFGVRTLAVHPGARWRTKRWPVEKFAVVACKAIRQHGFSVVILGNRDECDLAAQLERLIRQMAASGRVANLAGRTSLKQLAAVLHSVDVLLTNDSGPMHLAAALQTPVLGVFTCTSPLRSGPPQACHELVATQVRCAASYRKRCPKRGVRHMACMDELNPERVLEALGRLVEGMPAIDRAA